MLRFLLNDSIVTETGAAADLTVLDYLREQRGLCGTKEGCASGDCGACTAVIAYQRDGKLYYKSINTCITLLCSLHGQQLITVEHLQDGEVLHPVQAAMVNCHASQCGFCTPGFVMSLFALIKNPRPAKKDARLHIERYLGGNLCRCTGYRPILDAATLLCQADSSAEDKFSRDEKATIQALSAIPPESEDGGFYRPQSIQELCELRARYPDAPIVAGGTDLSLEITQRLQQFEKMICVQHLSDLNYITGDENYFYIGPSCTIAELVHGLQHLGSDFDNLLHRFGGTQVRNQGTVGGSIGTASPIGDLAPVFIALAATVVLQSVDGQRSMPLEDYFVDYRKTQLQPNEIVREIKCPRKLATSDDGLTEAGSTAPVIATETPPTSLPMKAPSPEPCSDATFTLKVYKVSKRIDDDISTVCAAFYIHRVGDCIQELRTGFGGMAAIPKRAHHLEKLVRGQTIDDELLARAAGALAEDFQPISDARASASYRLQLAENLFRRLCIETGSSAGISRVSEHV